jgi:NAD(P)-dependent dehydrogenase (short-subunit alcohol dehydrogenase family)
VDVRGKTAIITGASRGIGKQLAIELGRRGANVVVAARTVDPHRRLSGTIGETVSEVEAAGGQSLAVRTDLTDVGDIEALARAAVERFGGVDVLVNNAADTSGGTPSIADLDRVDWLHQFDTNLHGPFSLIQAVLPSMRQRGGGVMVMQDRPTSSGPIRIGERTAYAASKAALNRLGNVIAPELRAIGIAVVTIDPGFTRTELVELMGERGMVDPDSAVPMEVPVRAAMHVVTCEDPLVFTGTILRAAAFVREHRL